MAYSLSQNKATQKYIKNNYEEIKIRVPKGRKDIYKKLASDNGQSLNSFILDLLEKYVKKDTEIISAVTKVKQSLATMAIEDMYFDNDFVDKLVKVANGELSSEELRQEVIKQYGR